jgi:hypothetical protein
MSKHLKPLNSRKAPKRLADDLAELDRRSSPITPGDIEMLSIIINEALSGIDISKRYPTFYKKILRNPNLSRVFTDSLETLEKSRANDLVGLPDAIKPDLSFLRHASINPKILTNKNGWQIQWQRTVEQLQTLFFPSGMEMAYRQDPSLFDDTWFTLLRESVDITDASYSILLECGISEDLENSLSAFLNVAVTLESETASYQFPIFVTLNWGEYKETIEITEQGRVRFPDIPLKVAFDDKIQNITSELNFMLETAV